MRHRQNRHELSGEVVVHGVGEATEQPEVDAVLVDRPYVGIVRKTVDLVEHLHPESVCRQGAALDGRGVGRHQAGGERAADYIAEQFKSYGLETSFQQVPLVGVTTLPSSSLTLAGRRLKSGDDYVVNNQVGFTTNFIDARSSTYCTDIAKVVLCPVFHVNGDDVEALSFVSELAMEFRQTFHRDVLDRKSVV